MGGHHARPRVLLCTMLIDAFHATLEDREVALNRVGVHVAANIFVRGVPNGFVAVKLRAYPKVEVAFIRVQTALSPLRWCGECRQHSVAWHGRYPNAAFVGVVVIPVIPRHSLLCRHSWGLTIKSLEFSTLENAGPSLDTLALVYGITSHKSFPAVIQ